MADNRYQIGDLVPLEATFRNAAGVVTNPTSVTLTVRAPDGTVTTPTPTNPSTGVYHYDLNATLQGLYWYTFKGTGALQAADRNSFYVEQDWLTSAGPLSTRALVSLEEAREYVLESPLDDSQDSKLIRRINAFSEAVWGYTKREWKPTTAATRTFHYRGKGTLDLSPYDLVTATLVRAYTDFPAASFTTMNPQTSTDFGDYELRPSHGVPPENTYRWLSFNAPLLYFRPWASQQRGFDIQITGNWGLTAVPADVKEAVLLAIDDATRNPEGGSTRTFGDLTITEDTETTADDRRWRALPAESRALLSPYLDDVGVIVG